MATQTAPTLTDIEAARGRILGHARSTPVYGSSTLSRRAGRKVWLKAENLQRTGSFKVRGAVTSIDFLEKDPSKVAALIDIAGRTPVKTDTKARLESQGLTGVAAIALTGGEETAPPLEPGPEGGPPGRPRSTAVGMGSRAALRRVRQRNWSASWPPLRRRFSSERIVRAGLFAWKPRGLYISFFA